MKREKKLKRWILAILIWDILTLILLFIALNQDLI